MTTTAINLDAIRTALIEAEGGPQGSYIAVFANGDTSGFHSASTSIEDDSLVATVPAWSNDDIEDAGTVEETSDWIIENYEMGNNLGFW